MIAGMHGQRGWTAPGSLPRRPQSVRAAGAELRHKLNATAEVAYSLPMLCTRSSPSQVSTLRR